MSRKLEIVHEVPTNVITGFLGVGKTTAIIHLIKNKPAHERWAVLVNEFGEIGVDGALIQGQHREQEGVFVREVPGGCMCCAAGLPMKVALTQLLASSRPDRLLIEPTGLGHPKEVLQTLLSGSFREALNVQKTITLVNARHLKDKRYTENNIYNQQIEVADIVVANKSDLYQEDDEEVLLNYLQESDNHKQTVIVTSNGVLDYSILDGEGSYEQTLEQSDHHSHSHSGVPDTTQTGLPDCGYLKKQNRNGDGQYSVGWRFREEMVFLRERLFSFISGIEAQRVKGVMNTEQGVFGYNSADGTVSEVQLFGSGQSCLEIINSSVDDAWELQMLKCLSRNTKDHEASSE